MNNHYAFNFHEKSILYTGTLGRDKNGWSIIDWLLDLKRNIKDELNIDVDTISCNNSCKNGIFSAFAIWSVSPGECIDTAKPDSMFLQDCIDSNAIFLGGNEMVFTEIDEDGIIYLSCSNEDRIYSGLVIEMMNKTANRINWKNIPEDLQFLKNSGVSIFQTKKNKERDGS